MNRCEGLRSVEGALPSPKFQNQEVPAPPVEVSVNCTLTLASGAIGAKLNDASGTAGITVTFRCAVLEPFAFVTVRRTT